MKKYEDIKGVMWKGSPMPGMFRCGLYDLSTGVRCSVFAGIENGYDHVSVELYARRLPTWNEMCEIKDLFFDEEDMVVQIHPRKSEYVDITEALHLWRPHDDDWSIFNKK